MNRLLRSFRTAQVSIAVAAVAAASFWAIRPSLADGQPVVYETGPNGELIPLSPEAALALLQADPFEAPDVKVPPASPPPAASASDASAPISSTTPSPAPILGGPFHPDPYLMPYGPPRTMYDYGNVNPAATLMVLPGTYHPWHPCRIYRPISWYQSHGWSR